MTEDSEYLNCDSPMQLLSPKETPPFRDEKMPRKQKIMERGSQEAIQIPVSTTMMIITLMDPVTRALGLTGATKKRGNMPSRTVDREIAILLEKASSVKIKSDFEKKVLADRIEAFENYGFKAVITKKQLELIQDMADRFDAVHSPESKVPE